MIILLTTSTCPKCPEAKQLLEEAGIEYKELKDSAAFEVAMQHGISTVPTIITDDNSVCAGTDGIKSYIENM